MRVEASGISIYARQQHPFQIVAPTMYPFVVSLFLFLFVFCSVAISHELFPNFWLLHAILGWHWCLFESLFSFLFAVFIWGVVVRVESDFEHTFAVQRNLRLGALLFILSEVCFFLTIFVAFFYIALEPRVSVGCLWPPLGILAVSASGLPFFNTLLLLASGVFLVWCHAALLAGDWSGVYSGLVGVLSLSLCFLFLQGFEYVILPFGINDSVYAAFFFLMTGFHGLHVLIGFIFFIFCFIMHKYSHIYQDQHVFFECSAWYWHFVDVVWFFVYLNFYVWGSWGAVAN